MPTVLRNLSRRSRPFRYAGHAGWAALVVLQLGAGLQNVAMLCCLAYCVVWPFLLDGLQRWHAQPAFTTRLHVVEGCTTGLLLGCAPLSTTGTVAVVAALLAGNAALAGRGLMLRVGVALGLGYLAASLVGGSRARRLSALVLVALAVLAGPALGQEKPEKAEVSEAVRQAAAEAESSLQALTADGVDETLKRSSGVAATADSAILDACGPWLNLARIAVERHRAEVDPMWLLDFS